VVTIVRQLLEVLSDGEFHSGEELGRSLAISRSAVWKQLSKLADLHIQLESVRGRGYCLPGGLELFNETQIKEGLRAGVEEFLTDIRILDIIDSTNAYASRDLNRDRVHGTVYLAECQTGGRGRMGRTWVSPYGRNVYLSLVWEFDGGVAVLEGLSLAVGVAVHRAVSALGVADVSLKWPNDVLRDDRKLGGILLEMNGDPVGVCQVIVGIGLNVAVPASVAEAIGQPWHDLSDHNIGRNSIVAAVLSELLPMLASYPEKGFPCYREEWEKYHEHQGQEVEIRASDRVICGIARGVGENGALCVELPEGRRYFSGGEVSVRKR